MESIEGKVLVRMDKNLYYLRGDFDGDGERDYAVAIRGPKTRRNGVTRHRLPHQRQQTQRLRPS